MRKWVLRAFAIAGLLNIFWFGIGTIFAHFDESRVRRAWAATVLPMDEFERQHPGTSANPAVLAVADKAKALGCDLRSCAFPPSTESERGALDSLPDSLLLKYVGAQLSRADDEVIEEPPQELAVFLTHYASPLQNLEAEVLGSPELVWTREPPSVLSECPAPWVLRKLVSLLRLDALDQSRKGNSAGADRALEASWKLNSAFRDSPLVIGRLIAIAIDSDILQAVRRLAPPSEAWRARVGTHDHRRSVLASFQGEVIFASEAMLRENAENAQASLWCRLSGVFEAPYRRMCLASYSDLMRRATLGLRTWKDPCDFDTDSFVQSLQIPRWNAVARESVPLLTSAYKSAAEIALDQEVTSRILEARSAPEVSWFKEGAVRSSVCESLVWKVEHRPEGAVTLSPSRPLPRALGNLTVTRSR
jgi:hypothetical protein